MRKILPILMVAASAFSLWLAAASNASSQQKADPKDALKVLLQERLALAEKMHELVVAGYRGGDSKYSFVVVHDAKMKLLAARLDLADTKEKRLTVLEDMVKDAAALEKCVVQLHKVGGGSYPEVLNARIYHLDRQIALARAQGI